jgi:hypothetical protein
LRLLVAGQTIAGRTSKGWTTFEINSLLDHEVIVSI